MRFAAAFVALVSAAPSIAQNWHVPENNAAPGNCNVIPFGQGVGGPYYQCKYQLKATRAALGAMPALITGLGFAACATGTSHFGSIEIVVDHHPAGLPLSTTFASNLTPGAVTVLVATD